MARLWLNAVDLSFGLGSVGGGSRCKMTASSDSLQAHGDYKTATTAGLWRLRGYGDHEIELVRSFGSERVSSCHANLAFMTDSLNAYREEDAISMSNLLYSDECTSDCDQAGYACITPTVY